MAHNPPEERGRRAPEAVHRSREREQAALAELSQSALRGEQLSSLFNSALALVRESLRVRFCGLLELTSGTDTLIMSAGLGWKQGYVGAASVPASRPSVAASDGGAGSGVVGSAGKSISIQPSSAREHTRTPLLVWNVPAPPST